MAKLKFAILKIGKVEHKLPIIRGTDGPDAIDIRKLREMTGGITTFDPGFGNTSSCKSAITYLDGKNGILRHRGYPIEQLAEKSKFIEVAYLLMHGELPSQSQLDDFSSLLTKNSVIHESMKIQLDGFAPNSHPMQVLSSLVGSLGGYYPELTKTDVTYKEMDIIAAELISKVRTMCAFAYKKSIGAPVVYPADKFYVRNLLHMMFTTSMNEYVPHDSAVDAVETLFTLHADHEQNCSTTTVRAVGSSLATLFDSISAGIKALSGPSHGGASQKVVEMLIRIKNDSGNIHKYVEMAKNTSSHFRLMGFGHRVYKTYDPRAKFIKAHAHKLFEDLGINSSLLELACKLEEIALKDSYFIEKNLYPNVDFYSGLIYLILGVPVNMFPVMFAIARMPGWIANWMELRKSPNVKIARPYQVYIGHNERDYVPIESR